MNFSNTKRVNALCRFQFSKIFYLLPFLTLSFLVALLGVFVIESAGRTTFATPGAPGSPGHPATLTTSVSSPTVNFHFSAAELQSSTFKTSSVTVNISTNNETGATTYLSSVDEDTNLNSTDPTISQKFTSITSETSSSGFTQNKWGYRASTSAPSGNYKPIAKASQADLLYAENTPNTVTYNLEFGVKPSPDLPSGTYTKQILISSITNHVPTSTVFIPGQNFKNAIISLGPTGGVVGSFKHANAAPPAGTATTIVSTADSEVPAYAWYDPAAQSILWWSDADTAYANEDSSHMFEDIGDNYGSMDLIDMADINTSRVKNMSYMFHGGKWIIKRLNLTGFDTSNVEDMREMFGSYNICSPSNIPDPIDFSSFNTSNVRTMAGMFSGACLPTIDIRNFDTRNVVDMQYTFAGLKNVRYLDLHGFDVSKVNNIGAIFSGNPTLVSLNLANWQLDSIHAMDSLFAGMHALTDLNLTGFTTKNVTDMHHMFTECYALTALDLSSFDTSKVTDMNNMFRDNFALKNLNLSSFNTSNVTNMKEMFRHDGVIYPLDVSTFDTRKVTNMDGMFYWTLMSPENATLDISNFDTRSLTSALGMFNYTKAKTIYASDQFNVNNVAPHPHEMFITNTNLVGGNGTQYVWPNNSSQYAHIDAPGNPGYFTRKP